MALHSEKVMDHFRNPRNVGVIEGTDGLPAYKMHCSVLAEEAIRSALDDYKNTLPRKDVRIRQHRKTTDKAKNGPPENYTGGS